MQWTHDAVVECEDADVAPVVDVVAAHDRVGVVLDPHAGERVPTYLIVLIRPLSTKRAGFKQGLFNRRPAGQNRPAEGFGMAPEGIQEVG